MKILPPSSSGFQGDREGALTNVYGWWEGDAEATLAVALPPPYPLSTAVNECYYFSPGVASTVEPVPLALAPFALFCVSWFDRAGTRFMRSLIRVPLSSSKSAGTCATM